MLYSDGYGGLFYKAPSGCSSREIKLKNSCCSYYRIVLQRDGYCVVSVTGGEQALLSNTGSEIISLGNDCYSISLPREGICIVKMSLGTCRYGSGWGDSYIDMKFKYGAIRADGSQMLVIPPEYDFLRNYCGGFSVYSNFQPKEQGYIDKFGKILPSRYTYRVANDFSEGFGVFLTKDGKIGYVDASGNEKLLQKHAYDINHFSYGGGWNSFHNGGLIVTCTGSYGIIDKDENWLVPPKSKNPIYFDQETNQFVEHTHSKKTGELQENAISW